jgi:hypothetical protein
MKLVINVSFKKIFAVILLLAAVYYFMFHFSIFPMKDVEVLRVNSPDGRMDAVYIQRDAGAMTVARYLIYVVPSGQKPGKKSIAVFGGKRVFDLKIDWDEERKLLIQYSAADVFHFRNYMYPFKDDVGYRIEIEMRDI